LRGRGAGEQRTGLAAAIEAMRALRDRGQPERGLVFVTCVAGEMGHHLIAEALVREHELVSAYVVLAIATGGRIGLGNLGRVDIHVEVEGVASHSSDPSRGVNAVDGAIELCRRLGTLPPLPADADLGQATLAITWINSEPRAPHTIPAHCAVTLDRRLVPGERPEAAVAQIAACADGISPQRVMVRAGHVNLPGKLPPDHALPRLAQHAATQVGMPAPFFYRRAALDAGYFIAQGMPAIMWGPGDPALAHTDEERVRVDEAVTGARAYLALTALACWDEPLALDE
jgi:succinyl-diaminopimelate desuccinylase